MSQAVRNRYRSDLLQFARRADEQSRDVGRESVEAAIVRALSSFQDQRKAPTCLEVTNAVLVAEFQNMPDLDRWLKPRTVGTIVRDQLGLKTKHTERGSVVLVERKRLRALQEKYGIRRCPNKPTSS